MYSSLSYLISIVNPYCDYLFDQAPLLRMSQMSIVCLRCKLDTDANDHVTGQGQRWHDECFRCDSCCELLSDSTIRQHGDEILCSGCYDELGLSAATKMVSRISLGESLVDSKTAVAARALSKPAILGNRPGSNPVIEKAPVSRSASSSLETKSVCQIASKRQVSDSKHAVDSTSSTLQCSKCHQTGQTAGKYCRSCGGMMRQVAIDTRGAVIPQKRAPPAEVGKEMCYRCCKQVYFAERITGAGNVYHKKCFTCASCSSKLTANLTDRDGELFCRNCYAKKYGPRGFRANVSAVVLDEA